MNPNDTNFNPGGIKDRVDLRDFQYKEVGFGAAVFDWNVPYDIEVELGYKLPVKDQGQSYSCGGQAWATYISILESLATKTFEERSAKYIYSQVYVPGGGSRGRDCADICVNQGCAQEAFLRSYQNSFPPTETFMEQSGDITQPIRNDAILSRLLSYAQVGNNINDVAMALQNNHGIVLGITGSNNGTWLNEFPQAPNPSDSTWNHWVYAGKAKMMSGVKYIGILNSWGINTGNQGWQWIPESYFPFVWSAWTHVIGMPAPDTFHHQFLKDLQYGQQGLEVKALQTALKIDGDFPATVTPTEYFGLITQSAVQKFQKKYGIVSSGTPATTGYGRMGPKTRAKLNSLFK